MPRAGAIGRLGTRRIGLVVGAGGVGKTVLLEQYASTIDGPALIGDLHGPVATPETLRLRLLGSLRRQSLTELADLLDGETGSTLAPTLLRLAGTFDDPVLLAVDDVHHADPSLVGLLAELLEHWPAPHHLVLAGRRLPARLAHVGSDRGVVIDTGDLAFDLDEATALFHAAPGLADLDSVDVQALLSSTERWAAALALARDRLAAAVRTGGTTALDRELVELLARPATVTTLVDRLLGSLDAERLAAIGRLAHTPWFDDVLARAAGLPEGIDELETLGLPFQGQPDEGYAFPDSVRDALVARHPRDLEFLALAAEHHLRSDRVSIALRILREPGLQAEAARVLSDLPQAVLPVLDPAEHAATVATLADDMLEQHPRILLSLADNHALSGQTRSYRAAVERAAELVQDRDRDDPARLAAEAAAIAMRTALADDDRTEAEIRALLDHPNLSPPDRARLDVAIGRAVSTRRRPEDLELAGQHFDRAARVFEELQDPVHLTTTSILTAMVAAWPLGRFDSALAHLQRALATTGNLLRTRVAVLPFQAFVLVDVGRYAEAEAVLGKLRHTAALASDERAAAYARWAMARMASQRGDAEATAAHCAALIASPAVLDTGNGAYVRADVAQLLARVGDLDKSHRHLAEARDRDPGGSVLVPTAALAVAAHQGDLRRVRAMLDELRGGDAVEPRDRWRITLLHAHAARLSGDREAAALAAAAFEEAAQLGMPTLPMVREARIARDLASLAGSTSPTAAELVGTAAVRLQLLGEVCIQESGHRRQLTGRPAELLTFLALHRGEQPAEAVIEALWPDSDPTRGRERLRTVVARTRRVAGNLVERAGDTLRLLDRVDVDVEEFLRLATRALERGPDGGDEDARAALALHRDHLAPQLAYLDWVDDARRHLRRHALDLLDLVAAHAERSDRTDDAIRALLDAIELDPSGERRYLAAARLLAMQGWRGRALDLLARCRANLEELGIPTSDDLDRLDGYLSRTPAT